MIIISANEIKECALSVNNFNVPTEYKNKEAISLLLLRLLLLEPGTNNSHPDMGIGIVSKYRFTMEDNLDELNSNIKDQIGKYLPDFTLQNINLQLINKVLHITIQVNDDYYGYNLDGETRILSIADLYRE